MNEQTNNNKNGELTIVFDLDGTLVDTAPDLCHALNFALRGAGYAEIDIVTVRDYVGQGARKMIERGLLAAGAPADRPILNDLEAAFLDHYRANIALESRPFPGVRAALERLAAQGHRLGVCTNKRENLSRELLHALDLLHFFPQVLGADTLAVRKPDPQHLLETVSRLGGSPQAAVMIGDTPTDVATAKAANIPVIVVSFGYTAETPQALGGDRIIDHYDELDGAIAAVV